MSVFDTVGPSGVFVLSIFWFWVGFCVLGFLIAGIAGAILIIIHNNKHKKEHSDKNTSPKD